MKRLYNYRLENRILLSVFGLMILFSGCNSNPKKNLFEFVDPDKSQLDFVNTITENDSINPIDCLNCFNGAGVGIGDFNNDGLSDVVFTGNQVSSALYLNKGNLKFENVSEKAQFITKSWVTGVSIVDINADGWDDIYLNVAGLACDDNCFNLLFVNQGLNEEGIPTFTEQAKAYGLDDGNYATQSVFFDYDQDGDLDVYIVHNKNNTNYNRNIARPKQFWPEYLSDYLLRNDAIEGIDHPVFTNVSKELNVTHSGFGLGVGIADFNDDQLVDVYVSNDFITEDLLYINKAHHDSLNPFFEESNKKYVGHMTSNGMGMDISDINNDGLWDILVMDMFPNSYNRQKRVLGGMNYSAYMVVKDNNYTLQYMRNTLQLGNGHLDGQPIRSSEVGFMHGISGTDWSWASLMVDFDNDGDKDIFVTNGYIKDVIDLDYIDFTTQKTNLFTPKKDKLKTYAQDLPAIIEPNFFYEQKDGDQFEDVSSIWTESRPSLSNGVAYADFDLDGDLDMVINNINSKAFLLENKTSEKLENHYLRLKLKGNDLNTHAIGSKIVLWHEGQQQHQFHSVIRGYLSSIDPIIHFGLKTSIIDSLHVIWPDGTKTTLLNPKPDQVLEIEQVSGVNYKKPTNQAEFQFTSRDSLLKFTHQENRHNEFKDQPLLMRQYSQSGPCIAAADIDGIKGDEIFIGGSHKKPGTIWFQNENGVYYPKQVLDSIYEDTDAVFFDADNDNDLDLYVASGGNEFYNNSPNFLDRLYLNNGDGHFIKSEKSLPELFQSTGCVRPVDIDQDNDLDLFIGARITAFNYPKTPHSSILINNNGIFTEQNHSGISEIGMVTDAIWRDIDNDSWDDLIVVGEFMPISIYKNYEGKLQHLSIKWFDGNNKNSSTEGWWNCIESSDFDQDGDIDFIVGNQGLNGFVRPKDNYPVYVYNGDYNGNEIYDPLLGQYFEHEGDQILYPIHGREDIKMQFPESMVDFYSYEDFVKKDFETLLNIKDLESETLKATTFESSYIENLGEGNFKIRGLPKSLQVSPINDLLVYDFDQNGQSEFLAVGNDFTAESNYGQFDALTGLLVKTDGKQFEVIPSRTSGFNVQGQSHHMIKITDAKGRNLIIATQNDEPVKVFEIK
ncbi:VCBS repeat-containing protein [Lutimonas halocynthiae]|uniref:VCBS repeat-containing protein n=1 Tax=Lutimonas halocynthiae TaxID=1446477 RepID=UPI0025B30A53|nr:VCBS repeat-containing protein [Lutimonas halocynthiae]MDN3642057.1 VCBS repeat-containing protein [Lutimonas halocynthiae]